MIKLLLLGSVSIVLIIICVFMLFPTVRIPLLLYFNLWGDEHTVTKSGNVEYIKAMSDTDLLLYHIDDKNYLPSQNNNIWENAFWAVRGHEIRPEANRVIIGIYNNSLTGVDAYKDCYELDVVSFKKNEFSNSRYIGLLLRGYSRDSGFDWGF